jgi:hypothetical protein
MRFCMEAGTGNRVGLGLRAFQLRDHWLGVAKVFVQVVPFASASSRFKS